MKFRNWYTGGRIGLILVLPTLIVVGLFTVYPLFEGIRVSFTNQNLTQNGYQYIGFGNYTRMFHSPVFWQALWHSIVLTTAAVLLQLVFGLVLASALKQDAPGIRFVRSIIMASWVIPVAATTSMFKFMAQPDYGYVNLFFKWIGLGSLNTFWFGNIHVAFVSIIVLHLWRNTPFYAVALMAAMQAVPGEQYESARADGAGPLRSFFYITLPSISNMVIVIVTIHVLWTFNNFDMVYLTTGGGPVYATQVLPVYLYNQAWSNYDTGYAAAIGTIMFLVLMVYFIVYMRMYRRTEN